MDLIINGESQKVPETVNTMQQLIAHLELKSPVIIAEHNGTILQKDAHERTEINHGDKIEFVQFVGGG
jgi:sulfur carrier protein